MARTSTTCQASTRSWLRRENVSNKPCRHCRAIEVPVHRVEVRGEHGVCVSVLRVSARVRACVRAFR